MTLTQLTDHAVSVAGIAGAVFVSQADTVETFWPTSAVGRINTLLALGALVTVFWRGWRFSQGPTEKRFATVEKRLVDLEAAQEQNHETAAAIQEIRRTVASLERLFRDADRLIREHGEGLARVAGRMEAWDGRERRRSERRHHDDPDT